MVRPLRPPSSLRVAVAVGLASAGARSQAALEAEIQEALEKARQPLMAALSDAMAGAMVGAMAGDGGVLGLVCLAALHDGVPADDKVLQPALARLAGANTQATYALSLRLLVAEACPAFPGRTERAAADCKALLLNRRSGGFGYQPSPPQWDMSNTQYAALGLRAAATLGVEIPRKVWLALADAAIDAQRSDGGFGYRPGEDGATASMTAAGIAVLAICAQAASGKGRTIPELDDRLRRAWKWYEHHAEAIGDGEMLWSSYAHYGLERAAILCDVVEVGGVDWYRRGARMFVDRQLDDGSWLAGHGAQMLADAKSMRGSPTDTAFAVLFLRRKFQKVPGPLTAVRTVALASLGPKSDAAAIHACVQGLVRRGASAIPDVLFALRGEVTVQRRAAYRALVDIAGEGFGVDPERDARDNELALRRVELWYLKHR